MSIISSKRLLYIDSHARLSGTHNNFTYQLDYKGEVYDYCVLQASIPKSYWLIQSGQNTFTLDEISNQVTITIPVGNYSRSSFAYQLQYQLNTDSPNDWTYQISIPNSSLTGDTSTHGQFLITQEYSHGLSLVNSSMNSWGLNQIQRMFLLLIR